ncbi:MAG: PepSY-associated TM helix domain-containing protein [Pseudorhodoferax sp.]
MRGFSLPRPRQLWRQLHWCIGITAGTLLMAIGLSGAILSYREEVTDWLNPGGRSVAVRDLAALQPNALLAAGQRSRPGREVGTLTVFAVPGAAARMVFAPSTGQRRGDTVYLDPYTGAALPPLRGGEFFETVDSLHRWLLLPREPGRATTGVLAVALLLLAASGLVVRWPRQWRSWRAWFGIAPKLKTRALLARWHAVVGTCVLPVYVLSAATGLYWSFDAVRDQAHAWWGAAQSGAPEGGQGARMRAAERAARQSLAGLDIGPAWTAFAQRAGAGWSEASIRAQGGARASLQLTWLDRSPAHERARNRMRLSLPQGDVLLDERHDAKPTGERLLAAVYPLHVGSYFGPVGRAVMLLAALALPLFGISGWWLYLDRRRPCSRSTAAVAAARRPLGRLDAPGAQRES